MLITHIMIRDLPDEPFRLLQVNSDGSMIESSLLTKRMISVVLDDAHQPIGWAVYEQVGSGLNYELAGLRGVD